MNRETVAVALFERLAAVSGVVTSSRRFRMHADVSPGEMPALFFSIGPSTMHQPENQRPLVTLIFDVGVYVHDTDPEGVAPQATANGLVASIETALLPSAAERQAANQPGMTQTTLGGLVLACWLADTEMYDTKTGAVASLTIQALAIG